LQAAAAAGDRPRTRLAGPATALLALAAVWSLQGPAALPLLTQRVPAEPDAPDLAARLAEVLWSVAGLLTAPALAVAGAVWVAEWVQAGFRFGPRAPAGPLHLTESAVAVLTAAGVVAVAWVTFAAPMVPSLARAEPDQAAAATGLLAGRFLWRAAAVLAVGAAADYLLQRRRWWARMRMTRAEVLAEQREQGVDPHVRRARRDARRGPAAR
jgi:hypothetical protein